MQPPNDQRNFVHKKLFGAAKGFATGGITGAIGGFLTSGSRKRTARARPRPVGARSRASSRRGGSPSLAPQIGQAFNPPPSRRQARCAPGSFRVGQTCVDPFAFRQSEMFTPAGPTGTQGPTGTAMTTTGIYSPVPDNVVVRRCFPGDVLGKDGFCHKKGSIPNKEREYPRGTKPLGTPGEMAALAKAAAFGRRMETTVKRMQKIGVLKKPKRSTQRRITSAAQHHAGG